MVDAVGVWIDFNVGSGNMVFLAITFVFLLSASACILAISISRHSAAAELAHYGGSRRKLSSFVCQVCLHRSYAESHIRRRYCARCDKTFPEAPKTWAYKELAPDEYRPGVSRIHYRRLAEPDTPLRRTTRA